MKGQKLSAMVATAFAGLMLANLANAEDKAPAKKDDGAKTGGEEQWCANDSCKGKSACKGNGNNTCGGHNSCKGHGWLDKKTEADCKSAGGTWKKGKKPT